MELLASKMAKMAQDGTQDGPKTPPRRPRWPKDGLKMTQDASNTDPRRPKMALRRPTRPLRRSKSL